MHGAEPRNHGASEPRYSYRNLVLWQRAQEFAVEIIRLVDSLPAKRSVDSIARQIVRSATSIGANIAEGHGRFTIPAYKNHLSIAKGSACETESWLDLLHRLDLITSAQADQLSKQSQELIAALTGRMRDLERQGSSTVREEPAEYVTAADLNGSEVLRF